MRRILIELIVLTILVLIFFHLLRFAGLRFGWVANLAILTVPASIAGELYGRRTGQEITSIFAWQVAFAGGALVAVFNSLYAAAWGFTMPLGFAFVLFLLSFLAIRLVFRWGVTFGVRKTPRSVDPEVFD